MYSLCAFSILNEIEETVFKKSYRERKLNVVLSIKQYIFYFSGKMIDIAM